MDRWIMEVKATDEAEEREDLRREIVFFGSRASVPDSSRGLSEETIQWL
jgi:hypothetical protein